MVGTMPTGFAILGDGAWGTAIAVLLAQDPEHRVSLWSAREENGRLLQEKRENVRLLPGVLGAEATLEEESFERGLLEYPHYTRPAIWRGRPVPEVLISGHHEKIRAWRLERAEEITRGRRPDLWSRYDARRKV